MVETGIRRNRGEAWDYKLKLILKVKSWTGEWGGGEDRVENGVGVKVRKEGLCELEMYEALKFVRNGG